MIRIMKREYKDLMNGFNTDGKEFKVLYNASINNNIDLIKLAEKHKTIIKTDKKSGDEYVKDIIEVSYTMRTDEYNCYELRKLSYKNGFNVDGVHFVRFKRSDGSARQGKCLFIKESLYKEIMKWSFCGIDVKKDIDLAGFEAYISKTLSDCIGTFRLNMKNILLIKDYYSTFNDNVIKTDIKDGILHTDFEENQECKNNVWDGQSLGDISLFKEVGLEDKGEILVRNRMTKTCVFNTNIQQYYKDNNITLDDIKNSDFYIYTGAESIEDIKLIMLPSDIKYLKFGSYEEYAKLLDEWDLWGIVKYEKPTHFYDGELVNTHYQLLNTVDMNEDDVKEFMADTRLYVKHLKQNLAVFNNHINMNKSESIESDLLSTLLTFDKRVQLTSEFNSFFKDNIKGFKSNLKRGHIWTKGNYSTITANCLEMLKASCGLWDKKPIMKKETVYSKKFDFDKRLLLCRSPHIGANSIYLPMNTYYKEIDIYFNFSKEIIVYNAIGENTQMRLGGCDNDNDTVMVIDNPTLIRCALKHYRERINWVSYNAVESELKKRKRDYENLCELDDKTSNNLIGDIVNCSQLFITILNHERSKGNDITDYAMEICKLNAMSMLEIDKAKKEVKVDLEGELNELKLKLYNIQLDIGVQPYIQKGKYVLRKPLFFKELNKNQINTQLKSRINNWKKSHPYPKDEDKVEEWLNEYNKYKENSRKNIKNNFSKKFVTFNTAMDLITLEIDDIFKSTRRISRKQIKDNDKIHCLKDLMVKNKGKADFRKMSVLLEVIKEYKSKIDKEKLTTDEGREQRISDLYSEMFNKLPKKLDDKTIEMFLRHAYDVYNINNSTTTEVSRFVLSILNKKYRKSLLKLFRYQSVKVGNIVPHEKGDIIIYGISFKNVE